ncbi:MAG: hypothetical protein F6J86_03735 [Symploca sp. SIO1B1]|nr:hypothetical protein [Symploca sp. SIO1B1]
MTITLKNNPIWYNLSQTLEQIDANQIAEQHLQACNAQINGYWDEDEFYEVISFSQLPHAELTSGSWVISPNNTKNQYWLQLKFALTINLPVDSDSLHGHSSTTIGDLILILDENIEVVDENWLININSPYIIATPG